MKTVRRYDARFDAGCFESCDCCNDSMIDCGIIRTSFSMTISNTIDGTIDTKIASNMNDMRVI